MLNSEPSDVVGQRVRDTRKRAGLSVEQLSALCAKHGIPLTAAAIYLIEGGGRGKSGKRGRRRVTVEELLGLAYTMGVSPLALLLPPMDVEYAITESISAAAVTVYEWIIGDRLPPLTTKSTDKHRYRARGALAEALPFTNDLFDDRLTKVQHASYHALMTFLIDNPEMRKQFRRRWLGIDGDDR